MDLAGFTTRLKTLVPDLGGRVQGAADFLRLTATGGDPPVTPVAFVIPSGIAGGQVSAQTGSYVQVIERLFSVILVLRTDAAGARVLDRLDALIDAIVAAITGWDLGLLGVFTLKRVQLVRSAPGTLSYDISFGIADRIKKVTS